VFEVGDRVPIESFYPSSRSAAELGLAFLVSAGLMHEIYDIRLSVMKRRVNENGENDRFGTDSCIPWARIASLVVLAIGGGIIGEIYGVSRARGHQVLMRPEGFSDSL
jgi:hypothetical protein